MTLFLKPCYFCIWGLLFFPHCVRQALSYTTNISAGMIVKQITSYEVQKCFFRITFWHAHEEFTVNALSECSQWMLRKYCSSAVAQWEQLDDLGSDPCLVGKHQSCWSVPEQDIQSSLLTPKICQLVISPVKMHKHIMNWDFLQMFHWLVFVLQQSASWCTGI